MAAYLEKVIACSMVTHTPVTDYLELEIAMFIRIYAATSAILRKRGRGG